LRVWAGLVRPGEGRRPDADEAPGTRGEPHAIQLTTRPRRLARSCLWKRLTPFLPAAPERELLRPGFARPVTLTPYPLSRRHEVLL
jgi:hypothetical protein